MLKWICASPFIFKYLEVGKKELPFWLRLPGSIVNGRMTLESRPFIVAHKEKETIMVVRSHQESMVLFKFRRLCKYFSWIEKRDFSE